jgi:amidase
VDYPGVVFPLATFSANDYQGVPIDHRPRNDTEHFIHSQWDPATFNNAPVPLQLIGRRHEEEKLLAMLSRVESALASNSDHSS